MSSSTVADSSRRSGVHGSGEWRAAVRLRLRDVTKRYGRLRAIDGVSLAVHSGEIVAVVGENGAGKSTLVRCIAGDLEVDEGRIERPSAGVPAGNGVPTEASVAVVWQDLGLCDDLDVVANIFLGRERGRVLLAEGGMAADARRALDQIGSQLTDVRARADTLSRGERQEVALARALAADTGLLVLDEPTASLSALRRAAVMQRLRELRDAGHATLLVSHDLDEVFALADRVVVLRHGRIVAEVSPAEVHTDDVAALMSGIETESLARRQLNRLKSLVAQLSAADPAASLPLVVSATAAALDQEMLCVHLQETTPDGGVLRRTAAIGLPDSLADRIDELPLGSEGGPAGTAAELARIVVVDDVRDDATWSGYLEVAASEGVRSAWSAPIVGTAGVLGTITGFGAAAGRLDSDRVELVSLYAGHAATAIERERLIEEVSRRNQVLESLRGMLETLAGPERVDDGLSAALLALCRGLGARTVGMLVTAGDEPARWIHIDLDGSDDGALREVAEQAPDNIAEPRRVAEGVIVAGLPWPGGRGVLVSRWDGPAEPGRDAAELLEDARRSLALALEGEGLELARREAAAARRSQQLQRELLLQLSHELRTPLTAIRGYASTLQQPDLTWDAESTERFLSVITSESARMERLVGDLLDSSAIESGVLRLRRDWTDLRLVLQAAHGCASDRDRVQLRIADDLEPIWADHDRLEQVFVNLMENALRHGGGEGTVRVDAERVDGSAVAVRVCDEGPGVPASVVEKIFDPRIRGDGSSGAGLGLTIVRGIAEAHGGRCELLPTPETTFRVVLPVEPAAPSARARASDDGPGEAAETSMGSPVAGQRDTSV